MSCTTKYEFIKYEGICDMYKPETDTRCTNKIRVRLTIEDDEWEDEWEEDNNTRLVCRDCADHLIKMWNTHEVDDE